MRCITVFFENQRIILLVDLIISGLHVYRQKSICMSRNNGNQNKIRWAK